MPNPKKAFTHFHKLADIFKIVRKYCEHNKAITTYFYQCICPPSSYPADYVCIERESECEECL